MIALSRATKSSSKQIHTPAEAEIRAMFAHRNPQMPARALTPLAKLVANFADVVAGLAVDQRERIPTSKTVLRTMLLRAARSRTEPSVGELQNAAVEQAVERHRGTGLGDLLTREEGRERLAQYVQTCPLESWAGPVAGPGEIEKQLRVARSTLNEWHRRGVVIGLLRGERKHVYPLDQFVDARPMQGIGDVAKIAPNERAAWLWLRQPHGRFDMRSPLDLLKAGQRDEVIQTAERDFV
jgi:Protein of unknown function (DUF2384)